MEDPAAEVVRWARMLYLRGYVVGLGGNISVKLPDGRILIKKRGRPMGFLTKDDLIPVGIDEEHPEASIDLRIHQEIYRNSGCGAVVHAHPPFLIAVSEVAGSVFRPPDLEGRYYIGEVPVVRGEHSTVHGEIGRLSRRHRVVLEAGHGVYVRGASLEECFHVLEMAELSAKVSLLLTLLRRP